MSDLEKLKQKKKQLDARIKAAEAREKSKARKLETRRKIILGGLFAKLNSEKNPAAMQLMSEMTKRMSDRDRALFNFNKVSG